MAATASCQKETGPDRLSYAGKEIVFELGGDGIDFDVQTRATEVSSVNLIYWESQNATTKEVVTTVTGAIVTATGLAASAKYWPAGTDTYNFMASNVSFTSSTGAINTDNTKDIVVGTASSSPVEKVPITLDHIFARTATLTLNTQKDYTLSNVSWKIKSKDSKSGTAGTYTIGSGWGTTATTALAEQEITSDSDLYLIPATYTLIVTYTLTLGAYSETFTKSADVTLVQGKKNSIIGTATGGNASTVKFNVTITAWGEETLTPTFS